MKYLKIVLLLLFIGFYIVPTSAVPALITGGKPYYNGWATAPLYPEWAVDRNYTTADARYYNSTGFPGTYGDGQLNGWCDPCTVYITQDLGGIYQLYNITVKNEKYGGADGYPYLGVLNVETGLWGETLLPTLTNGNVYTTTTFYNGSVNARYIRIRYVISIANNNYAWIKTYELLTHGDYGYDTLKVVSPVNNSVNNTRDVILKWNSTISNIPYTYILSTSPTLSPVIATGGHSSVTYSESKFVWSSATIYLGPNITYYWKVSDTFNNNVSGSFSTAYETPGLLNIQVLDEQTLDPVYAFNTTIYGANGESRIKSTSYGWANFTSSEVSSGEYTITVTPYSNLTAYTQTIFGDNVTTTSAITEGLGYSPRTMIVTSPGDVIVYVPNLETTTVNQVQFELVDMTGLFAFEDSYIRIMSNNSVMFSDNFDGSAKSSVYLIQGKRYYISVINPVKSSEYTVGGYVPSFSRTEQILISQFSVNQSRLYPLLYNITYDSDSFDLEWSDNGNVMNSVSFNVFNTTQNICEFYSTANIGGTTCSVVVPGLYNYTLSFNMTDGTFINSSIYTDYNAGLRQTSTGVSTYDGEPIGVGYTWDYETFTMPNWVYTWVSIIIFVAIIAIFGQRDANLGAIISLIMALIFEFYGVFRPAWNDSLSQSANMTIQSGIMGITGGFLILCILYYIANKDRGG